MSGRGERWRPAGFREIALFATLSAVMLGLQVVLAVLPNIELVSLLVILFTLRFGGKCLYIIYTFALLEGLVYGFGLWWVNYLYVWTVLFAVTYLFRTNASPLFWALVSGGFGLSFGALCSLPYFFTGGLAGGFAYLIAGIPFDILHCIGNIAVAAVLFRPLNSLLRRLA